MEKNKGIEVEVVWDDKGKGSAGISEEGLGRKQVKKGGKI